MRMIEIQEQLRKVIPTLDNSFNSSINIDSASVTSDVMQITAIGHGLSIGDKIVTSGINYVHEVDLLGKPLSLTASLVATNDIDFYNNEKETITLRSNETFYNGIFELKEVNDNRLNFLIKVNRNAPASTTDLIEVVEEDLCRYNNEFEVLSVIDADNFTVQTKSVDTAGLEGGSFYNVVENIRINATVDIQHVLDNVKQYQNVEGNWLFISSSASNISRDRNLKTDSPQRIEQGNDIQIDTWGEFSVFALINTGDSVDPVEGQDYCRNELRFNLLKSLLGYKPSSDTSSEYDFIYYDGDNILSYMKGMYLHQYNFGCTLKINSLDAFKPKSCLVDSISTDYLRDENVKASDLVTFTND